MLTMATVTRSLTCCVTVIRVRTRWLGIFLTSHRGQSSKDQSCPVHSHWQQPISHRPPPALTDGLVTILLLWCPSPSATTIGVAPAALCTTERKDFLSVASAAKLSIGLKRWRSTSGSTQERDLSAAPRVGRCFQRLETWGSTSAFTRGRNRTVVGCVGKDSPG